MKMVDHMHERTGYLSTKDTDAHWNALFVPLEIVFRQSRWAAKE